MPQQIGPNILSWIPQEQIETRAMRQLENTASLPFIFGHITVMPDCHYGTGATIGSCIPTRRAIIPAAVGLDIGCGMTLVKTSLNKNDLDEEDLNAIRLALEEAIPVSARNYNETIQTTAAPRIAELQEMAVKNGRGDFYETRVPNWRSQLGSLGSGNHFIELLLDHDDDVWTFLHSGSRGVGSRLAQHHINIAKKLMSRWFITLPDEDLAYLVQDTQEFGDYLKDLRWTQHFAFLNRAEMTERFLNVLRDFMGPTQELERADCHHNFTQWEHHQGENILVTRKGAIQARKGQRGMIPGSMGTRSYLVEGKGNDDSFHTAPHGAGRRMSRSDAKQTFTMEDFDREMQGIEVHRTEAFLDELPGAYKDMDTVMEQSHDLVDVVNVFHQVLNVKGE